MKVQAVPAHPPPGPDRQPAELRALTGLRGLAASLLLLYHMTPPTSANRFLEAAFRHGYLCVDLFFVLSGFVLSLVHQEVVRGPFSWRVHAAFLVRRVARVYPLYLASTLAALAVFAGLHMRGFEGQLLRPTLLKGEVANLLMVQNWGLYGSFNGAAWSISAEWSAYLLFPLFARAVFRSPAPARVVVLAGVVLCLAALARWPDLWPWRDAVPALRQGPLDRVDSHSVAPLLRCWTEFCLGMFAFRLFGMLQAMRPAVAGSLFVATTACLVAALSRPGTDLLVVLLYGPLIASAAPPGSVQAGLLGSWPIHRLGLYSYSFYMLFLFAVEARTPIARALAAVVGPPGFAALFTATLLLVLGASALSFHLFERPMRRRLALLAPRLLRLGPPGHQAGPADAAEPQEKTRIFFF